jgi:Aspartyl/Asparaginyl beta-hydroxylase
MNVYLEGRFIATKLVSETVINYRDLGEVIESFTTDAFGNLNSLEDVICSRDDCNLLQCRLPAIHLETRLGIVEDFVEDDPDIPRIDPSIRILCFRGLNQVLCMDDFCDYPGPPHGLWNRYKKTAISSCKEQALNMLWIDLRDVHFMLKSPSECCHFLRSIMGSSQYASPWRETDDEDLFSNIAIVTKNSSEVLEHFRTTDACPSYFLHSISRLEIPAHEPQWWMRSKTPIKQRYTVERATLLIYKMMPPRDHFSVVNVMNPLLSLPDGCLWETYRILDEIEANNRLENEDTFPPIFLRQVAPPYLNHQQEFRDLMEPILNRFETIRMEALAIPQWPAWPEKNHYSSTSNSDDAAPWTVFPLCHCFPANKIENRKWIQSTCAFVVETVSLLKEHLGDHLRTALFSRLSPETVLEAHTGWEDLANYVYRIHLPLVVPSGGLCGTWVDGVVETHEEGRLICFDDSKIHRAFNYSKQERIVLILDIARPAVLPIGTAIGGHTNELDDFINILT